METKFTATFRPTTSNWNAYKLMFNCHMTFVFNIKQKVWLNSVQQNWNVDQPILLIKIVIKPLWDG
jgi:hypothetical protein